MEKQDFISKLLVDYDLVEVDNDCLNNISGALLDATQWKSKKIVTISKVGYNMPSQANWAYGIWKVDLIDLSSHYSMSHTMKESFGGNSRFEKRIKDEVNTTVIETKGVYTNTGTPKITGISKMLDMESEEAFQIVREFLVSK